MDSRVAYHHHLFVHVPKPSSMPLNLTTTMFGWCVCAVLRTIFPYVLFWHCPSSHHLSMMRHVRHNSPLLYYSASSTMVTNGYVRNVYNKVYHHSMSSDTKMPTTKTCYQCHVQPGLFSQDEKEWRRKCHACWFETLKKGV